jgi:hypothetical protein
MIWETLLGAALEARLGVLAEAGFSDEVSALMERLGSSGHSRLGCDARDPTPATRRSPPSRR